MPELRTYRAWKSQNHDVYYDNSPLPRTHSDVRLFYSISRALLWGSHNRSPLPLELVLRILRLAECICPVPSRKLSLTSRTSALAASSLSDIAVVSWMMSQPLEHRSLSRIAQMQLVTVSRDQGWGNQGPWSWFEVAILTPSNDIKLATNGQPLSWRSHENRRARGFQTYEGVRFGPNHEIWDHVDVGDRLCVIVCAKFPGWQNEAERGTLKVWEWWEPKMPLRKPGIDQGMAPSDQFSQPTGWLSTLLAWVP